MDALEVFHPDRMSSRILGMGDMLYDDRKSSGSFRRRTRPRTSPASSGRTLSPGGFPRPAPQVKKMGSFEQILGMLPGMGMLKELKKAQIDPKEFARMEAIINSMTRQERTRARPGPSASSARAAPFDRGAGLEFPGKRRVQRLHLPRLDAGRGLGRPDRLPGGRPQHQEHRHLHGNDRRRPLLSIRRAGSGADEADHRHQARAQRAAAQAAASHTGSSTG